MRMMSSMVPRSVSSSAGMPCPPHTVKLQSARKAKMRRHVDFMHPESSDVICRGLKVSADVRCLKKIHLQLSISMQKETCQHQLQTSTRKHDDTEVDLNSCFSSQLNEAAEGQVLSALSVMVRLYPEDNAPQHPLCDQSQVPSCLCSLSDTRVTVLLPCHSANPDACLLPH
ncbi:hypothetical protein INR49_013395 [Caranx melampygus]|nr:hypothetical protein INR49_013395 [Caranx melampygus]